MSLPTRPFNILCTSTRLMRNYRADVFAAREHELDHHPLVFDQIVVEADLLTIVRVINSTFGRWRC